METLWTLVFVMALGGQPDPATVQESGLYVSKEACIEVAKEEVAAANSDRVLQELLSLSTKYDELWIGCKPYTPADGNSARAM